MKWCLLLISFFSLSILAEGQIAEVQPEPVEEVVDENEEGQDEAAEQESPPELAVLTVYVKRDGEEAEPIERAKVIVTYPDGNEFMRQTNNQGIAVLSRLPYGEVDIDVIASGMKSEGESKKLDSPETTIEYTLTARHSS